MDRDYTQSNRLEKSKIVYYVSKEDVVRLAEIANSNKQNFGLLTNFDGFIKELREMGGWLEFGGTQYIQCSKVQNFLYNNQTPKMFGGANKALESISRGIKAHRTSIF